MADFARVEGLRELDKMLADLGEVAGFKALRSAMMASSRPMFQAARANAAATGLGGTDSDAMAASMSRGTRKEGRTRTTLWIGPRNKSKKGLAIYNAFWEPRGRKPIKRLGYFHMVEFGTSKMTAQPFMRPAFLATANIVVANFAKELGKAIDKQGRKNARAPR